MPVPAELSPLLERMVAEGCGVIWLAGSYVTGGVARHSDVDLGVIQATPAPQRFEVCDGLLVSISTTTVAATRDSFRTPAVVGAAVPGWRMAELLHDPDGVGRTLQEEAAAWEWDAISGECDRWVARQVTILTDEVHKLLNALERAQTVEAAHRCGNLGGRLALVMSVHRRVLYGSERALFERVGEEVGGDWPAMHEQAMRSQPVPLDVMAASALWLYRFVAAETIVLLDSEQRAVADFTLRSVEPWLHSDQAHS